jgi:peptidoglycan/xylan/chitin deacetylase (PgdA/CDA1 family)
MNCAEERFVVCVHDAWPANVVEIEIILDALRPLVGKTISLAATPLPFDQPWPKEESGQLIRLMRECSAEVLLHGLTHRRAWSLDPLSALIGRHDEFAALDPHKALERLRQGRLLLRRHTDLPVRGLLPPAWRAGRIPGILGAAGLDFIVGMRAVRGMNGAMVPLATWSWDAGPSASLGYVLEHWGAILSWRKAAVPCVALHPADVRRNFLWRAMRLLRGLRATGRRPTTFGQLLAECSPP